MTQRILRWRFFVGMFLAFGGDTHPVDADPVTVVDIDEGQVTGRLLNYTAGKISVQGLQHRVFSTTNLVLLRYDERKRQQLPRASLVLLDNGDRLVVHPVKIDEDQIEARWEEFPSGPSLLIPLETVRAILFNLPHNLAARDRLTQRLFDYHAASDEMILLNGDRLRGELLKADTRKLTLKTSVGDVTVGVGEVLGLSCNRDLVSFPKAEGPRVLITLRHGTRLSVRNIKLDPLRRFVFDTLFGIGMMVPETEVVTMQFLGGRVVYLSDLTPLEYQFTPFLSSTWQLRTDRNVTGGPLRVRGIEYFKGLGMHSKSEVTYELSGKYRSFLATVGIDDTTDGQGNAILAIEVDGQRVFDSQPVMGRSPALQLKPIDVRHKHRLKLIVDFGQFGDIQDYVNWCNALLTIDK